MPREIAPGIHWIPHCGESTKYERTSWCEPGRAVHGGRAAYLIEGERTLLYDTLGRNGTELILSSLESLLGDRSLDYLAPSHPEYPHAGNMREIAAAYPEVELLAPAYGETHELYHLGGARKVEPGDVVDLGSHRVVFREPAFMDHYMHNWLYEETADVLFCVDWFGFPHQEDECEHFVDEVDTRVTVDRLKSHPTNPFHWFRFADPEVTDRVIDGLIETYGDATLAPTHGLVIREDADRYMEAYKDVIRATATDAEVVG